MEREFSVLIVEDDRDTLRNMEDILSLDNYRTRLETNCRHAVQAVGEQSFDAVIVDWRLPDNNADVLMPIIRGADPEMPIVVVTGIRDFDASVKALRSGAYDFLVKPINPDVLRGVLSRLVERKKHLNEIQQTQQQLLVNERLAAIGQMVAGLAHESRNAFQRSHACLAELALDLQQQPDSLSLVHKVQRALDDVHFLLEEVRDYSAPIVLERRPIRLPAMVTETWQQIVDVQKTRTTRRLNLTVADDFPETCSVDGNRLQQVVRNLLENARIASPPERDIDVALSIARRDPTTIKMEVRDHGDGVDPADRERIFAPFFTTRTKGTGLGLAVSRRIVDAHRGRVFVTEAKNGGANFVVEIPLPG